MPGNPSGLTPPDLRAIPRTFAQRMIAAIDAAFVSAPGLGTVDDASLKPASSIAKLVAISAQVLAFFLRPWVTFNSVVSSVIVLYVSDLIGRDSNVGSDPAAPLKSFAEVVNRYTNAPIISGGSMTVVFLDETVRENIVFHPFVIVGYVQVLGTLTALSSNTMQAPPTKRAGVDNTYLEVTLAAAPAIGALLVDSTIDAKCWTIKDAGGDKARCTPLIPTQRAGWSTTASESTTVANGDQYTLYTMTSFQGRVDFVAQGPRVSSVAGSGMFWVENCSFGAVAGASAKQSFSSRNAQMILMSCRFENGCKWAIDGAILLNHLWAAGASIVGGWSNTCGQVTLVQGGGSLVPLQFANPCNVAFQLGFLMQGGEWEPIFPGAIVQLSDAMAADWALSAVKITGGGAMWLGSAPSLSGTSAAGVTFRVAAGDVYNTAAGAWADVVPAYGLSGAPDFTLNGQTQGSPYVPGAGVAAAEVTYTMAHLDADAGAAGFGGSASRMDAHATMTKVQ